MVEICGSIFRWAVPLVDNEHSVRLQALVDTTEWLKEQKEMTELDARKIWRILFQALWMTDKPIPQHDFCSKLSELISVVNPDIRAVFIDGLVIQLGDQWNQIDRHRIEKFLVFVRYLTGSLLQLEGITPQDIFNKLLDKKLPVGLRLQFIDVVVESIPALIARDIPNGKQLLYPFCNILCDQSPDPVIAKRIYQKVVEPLVSTRGEAYFGENPEWSLKFLRGLSMQLNNAIKTKTGNREIDDIRSTATLSCREAVVDILTKMNKLSTTTTTVE